MARRLGGEAEAKRKHLVVVLNKSTVPVGGGDCVSVLIRDALEEASQGQEVASSEEASFLVVANLLKQGGESGLRLLVPQ